MRIIFFTLAFILLAVSSLLYSCKKEPGLGGHSSISGHITVRHYNANFNQYLGTYDGADEYVYIVFGNHSGYDQRIKTDYNGNFQFNYLYPGDYSIYTYSLDSTLQSLNGNVALVQNIKLEKREDLTLPDFIIFQ